MPKKQQPDQLADTPLEIPVNDVIVTPKKKKKVLKRAPFPKKQAKKEKPVEENPSKVIEISNESGKIVDSIKLIVEFKA